MTNNKELAERMEKLRNVYIEACRRKDIELQTRILRDEKEIALLIGNDNMMIQRELHEAGERMPRVVRIMHYEARKVTRNPGQMPGIEIDGYHVYVDSYEIEAIKAKDVLGQRAEYFVLMKSGREFSTNEDDFNLLERAMRERR